MSDRIAVMNHGRVEQVGAPTEIYERPRTRFVADFIGEINILEEGGQAARAAAGEDPPGAGRRARLAASSRPRISWAARRSIASAPPTAATCLARETHAGERRRAMPGDPSGLMWNDQRHRNSWRPAMPRTSRHRHHRPGAARRHRRAVRRPCARRHQGRSCAARSTGFRTPRSIACSPRTARDTLYTRLRGGRDVKISKKAVIARSPAALAQAARRRLRCAGLCLHRRLPADGGRRGRAVPVARAEWPGHRAAAARPAGPADPARRAGREARVEMGAAGPRGRRRGAGAQRRRRARPTAAARAARPRKKPDLVAMDCMSYTPDHQGMGQGPARRAGAARHHRDRPRAARDARMIDDPVLHRGRRARRA